MGSTATGEQQLGAALPRVSSSSKGIASCRFAALDKCCRRAQANLRFVADDDSVSSNSGS